MHDMIAKPAACAGLSVSEPLAARLIQDAGSEPGNLPLLAFVLQALFDRRQGNQLSETEYVNMGGLTGAIAQHIATVEADLEDLLGAETLQTHLTGLVPPIDSSQCRKPAQPPPGQPSQFGTGYSGDG